MHHRGFTNTVGIMVGHMIGFAWGLTVNLISHRCRMREGEELGLS